MKALVACAAIALTLMTATAARTQRAAKGVGPIGGYRTAAEKQILELKAKVGANGGADALSNVQATYETARNQQAAWVEALKAAASGTKTGEQVEAAGVEAAKAVFACVQARRTALGLPTLSDALAAGVQNRIIAEYKADGPRQVKALKGGPAASDGARALDDALLWKEWEAVK